MSTVKAGWLKDSNGDKFAPKTYASQVVKENGESLEEAINETIGVIDDKIDAHKNNADIHFSATERELLNTISQEATESTSGLMSAADKTKVNNTNIAYGECLTASEDKEKIISIVGNDNWELKHGSIIIVYFVFTNSAIRPNFNVNGTGSYPVYFDGEWIRQSYNLAYAGHAERIAIYAFTGSSYNFLGWSYVERDTDEEVLQRPFAETSDSYVNLPVLLSNDTSTVETKAYVNKAMGLTFNPGTRTLKTTNFDGNATSATTLTQKLPVKFGGTGAETSEGAICSLKAMPQVSYNNTQYVFGMDENGIYIVNWNNEMIFTIDETEYYADYSMTWQQWINSSYNTFGFIVSTEGGICTTSGKGVQINNLTVRSTDYIIENGAYVIQTGGASEPT